MFKQPVLLSAVLLPIAISTPALAADPAGEAVRVQATTRALGADGARFLETRGAVYTGDQLTTDLNGEAQLRFVDDTRLVVGPNSRVTIDDFVFAGPTTASAFTIGAVKGAFRFISGSSNKQAYRIDFPAGTIGVRGTDFDLSVDDAGVATVALYAGGLQVCLDTVPRQCAELDRSCQVLVIPPDGEFEWVQNVYERTRVMEESLPYAFRQRGLERAMRVSSGACDIREPGGLPGRDTESSSGSSPQPSSPPPQDDPIIVN